MNQLDLYKIKARPMICLLLFALGGALCILLDLCGVPCISEEPVLQKNFIVPISAWWAVCLTYLLCGMLIGTFVKNRLSAVIYAACLSQCHVWINIIYQCGIRHMAMSFDRVGVVLIAPVAAVVSTFIVPLSAKLTDRIFGGKQN